MFLFARPRTWSWRNTHELTVSVYSPKHVYFMRLLRIPRQNSPIRIPLRHIASVLEPKCYKYIIFGDIEVTIPNAVCTFISTQHQVLTQENLVYLIQIQKTRTNYVMVMLPQSKRKRYRLLLIGKFISWEAPLSIYIYIYIYVYIATCGAQLRSMVTRSYNTWTLKSCFTRYYLVALLPHMRDMNATERLCRTLLNHYLWRVR